MCRLLVSIVLVLTALTTTFRFAGRCEKWNFAERGDTTWYEVRCTGAR